MIYKYNYILDDKMTAISTKDILSKLNALPSPYVDQAPVVSGLDKIKLNSVSNDNMEHLLARFLSPSKLDKAPK